MSLISAILIAGGIVLLAGAGPALLAVIAQGLIDLARPTNTDRSRIRRKAMDRAAIIKLERTLDRLGLKLQPHVAGRRMAALGKTIKARNDIVRRALTTKFGGHHG